MSASDRELMMRCIELAVPLVSPNKAPVDILACAHTLYAALPTEAEQKPVSARDGKRHERV